LASGGYDNQFFCVLFNRKEFNEELKLKGHKSIMTISKFNPRIFQKGETKNLTYLAIGSNDKRVTIWTNNKLIIKIEEFENIITDMVHLIF
jgi:WD40 repeat protein